MRYSLRHEYPFRHACQALVIGAFEAEKLSPTLKQLDRTLVGAISSAYERGEFTGKLNSVKLIHTLGKLPAERLILAGLGKEGDISPERMRQAAGSAMQALRKTRIKAFSSALHQADRGDELLKATFEGFSLASYSFDLYKSEKGENWRVEEALFLLSKESAREKRERLLAESKAVTDAVCFARDLVSQPGNVATPAYLAERALEMAGKSGMTCHVLERDDMEREGMRALLGVAAGSHHPPRLIVLEYMGGPKKGLPKALVGKGVTFDSGGISLKPRDGMEKMKSDMAGGAAVMGAMMAASALRLPINLVGIIPAAENLPGGGAYKPGDVLCSMSGQTIEITNTDAEGRLLLCDALHYALKYRPSAVIDIATLTGACVVALGHLATGLMCNNEELAAEIKRAGEITGERVWELPLWPEYAEQMKSDIADLKNSAGPHGATITAAAFLSRFAGKAKWAHLDIAGTAWEEKGRPYLPRGATGVGVRLLVEYLRASAPYPKQSPALPFL